MAQRTEQDRRQQLGFLGAMTRRPEFGAVIVMLIVLVALGMASGGLVEGVWWNPLDGTAYNPLGIRNNTRIVAQLGIIAIGACLLMIAGEFDLSIGSMIGFAGMSMALMLKWGLHIPIPFTDAYILSIAVVEPWLAVVITLIMTLAIGWIIGQTVVRSGLPSFIVTLAFLFFLRGLTEVCYRFLNKAPGERSGSTQVSDLPDFKNLIDLERYRDLLTYPVEAAATAAQGCIAVFARPLNNNLASAEQVQSFLTRTEPSSRLSPDQLAQIMDQAGPGNDVTKEQIAGVIEEACKVDPSTISLVMERADAQRMADADLQAIFSNIPPDQAAAMSTALAEQAALDSERAAAIAGREPGPVPEITDLDVARAYFDQLPTTKPVADLFGGDIFEPVFSWLNTIGWNIAPSGGQWVDGLYAVVGWWIAIAIVAWVILEKTKAGNWIYSTGGNLQAARANGVPTNAVKISLFMTTAFCATIFAATQVFDTNSADAAKGNLKELEAIATAVVGGAILTGGFGSIVGVVFGAVIFGLAQNALFYIPWLDGAYYRMFLGAILLAAALLNENVRKRFTGGI